MRLSFRRARVIGRRVSSGRIRRRTYFDAGSLDVNLGNLRLFVRLSDPDGDAGWDGYQLILQRLITGCYWYLWRLDDGATVQLINQAGSGACWH